MTREIVGGGEKWRGTRGTGQVRPAADLPQKTTRTMFTLELRPSTVQTSFHKQDTAMVGRGGVMMWRWVVLLEGLVEALMTRVQVLEQSQRDLLLENAQLKVQNENMSGY